MFQPRTPSQIRLFRQQRKCLVSGNKEAMTDFRVGLGSKIVGLLIQITIRFWTNDLSLAVTRRDN